MIKLLIVGVLLGGVVYWYYDPKISLIDWLKGVETPPNNPQVSYKFNLKRFAFWRRMSQTTLFLTWFSNISPQEFEKLPDSAQTLSRWLVTLSDKEVKKLMQYIDTCCAQVNLNLAWLYNGEADDSPIVKQTLEEIVLLSGMAYAKIKQTEASIVVFNTYREWDKNPLSRKQKKFTRDLFAQLQAKGLVAPIPGGMAMASRKQRAQFVVKEIRNVAVKDRHALDQVLRFMLFGETSPTRIEQQTQLPARSSQNSVPMSETIASPVLPTAATVEA